MNRQEAFNIVWTGLRSQGFRQARSPDGGYCVFETFEVPTLRCALGWVAHVATGSAFNYMYGLDGEIQDELRTCHNDATSPVDMENRYREYAKAHGLTIPLDDGFSRFMARVREPVSVEEVSTP